jgi:5-(aminomethyl)-3-furanmethanol phosphate kinase
VKRLAVVKLGGGLARTPGALARAAAAIEKAAQRRRLLVIPGGGVLADAVRLAERELALTPTAAHWMAILAMDQFAYAIASAIPGSRVVHDAAEIQDALADSVVPVLAPYRWMLAADVLPHGWQATSDSIAAFIAGALDAECLVLLKPVSGAVEALVDLCFRDVQPIGLTVLVLGAGEMERLPTILEETCPKVVD